MSEIPHDDTAVQHPSGLPLAHWLTLTEGLIAARVAESLEEHGLTRAQWQLLNTLTVAPQSRAELEAVITRLLGWSSVRRFVGSPAD